MGVTFIAKWELFFWFKMLAKLATLGMGAETPNTVAYIYLLLIPEYS